MINLGDLKNGMDVDYVLNNITVDDYPILITHLQGKYDDYFLGGHKLTGKYHPNELFYLHNGYLVCDVVNTRVIEYIQEIQSGMHDIGFYLNEESK